MGRFLDREVWWEKEEIEMKKRKKINQKWERKREEGRKEMMFKDEKITIKIGEMMIEKDKKNGEKEGEEKEGEGR